MAVSKESQAKPDFGLVVVRSQREVGGRGYVPDSTGFGSQAGSGESEGVREGIYRISTDRNKVKRRTRQQTSSAYLAPPLPPGPAVK